MGGAGSQVRLDTPPEFDLIDCKVRIARLYETDREQFHKLRQWFIDTFDVLGRK